MKKSFYWTLMLLVVFIGVIFLTGCVPKTPKPDLVPVNPEGWAAFCDSVPSQEVTYYGKDLRVHIKNQGDAPAGSSVVVVEFGGGSTSSYPVPALAVGETTTILFPIPQGCFSPDCGFKIIVDYYDDVDESNELNNSQIGNCIG